MVPDPRMATASRPGGPILTFSDGADAEAESD